jgi:hypothetical protein
LNVNVISWFFKIYLFKFNLHHYSKGSSWLGPLVASVILQQTGKIRPVLIYLLCAMVGGLLHKSNPVVTHSLKPPGLATQPSNVSREKLV